MGTPKVEKANPAQEMQQPVMADFRKKKNKGEANGTLLTGPMGPTAGSMNTGAPTLLGN